MSAVVRTLHLALPRCAFGLRVDARVPRRFWPLLGLAPRPAPLLGGDGASL